MMKMQDRDPKKQEQWISLMSGDFQNFSLSFSDSPHKIRPRRDFSEKNFSDPKSAEIPKGGVRHFVVGIPTSEH